MSNVAMRLCSLMSIVMIAFDGCQFPQRLPNRERSPSVFEHSRQFTAIKESPLEVPASLLLSPQKIYNMWHIQFSDAFAATQDSAESLVRINLSTLIHC